MARPSAYIVAALLLVFTAGAARAEFLQTGSYYSYSRGTAFVIPTQNGPYFVSPREKVSLQSADILNIEDGYHAFLSYDKSANRYSALHVGDKKYEVNGSFAVIVGNMLVKVDNYSFSNPYATVEINPKVGKPAIIAFQGPTVVANYASTSAVAVLTGNQALENIPEIYPYKIEEEGNLTLNGKPVKAASIGLNVQRPESPCLQNYREIAFLTESELTSIRNNKNETERRNQLAAAIKRNRVDILAEFILLKATSKELVTLDPNDGNIKIIDLVSHDPKICQIKTLRLN